MMIKHLLEVMDYQLQRLLWRKRDWTLMIRLLLLERLVKRHSHFKLNLSPGLSSRLSDEKVSISRAGSSESASSTDAVLESNSL